MDRHLRKAERSGDASKLLRGRLRAGELTQEHVELAASLGHRVALELCPDAPPVDWTDEKPVAAAVEEAATLLGDETLPARLAADWAESLLPMFEEQCPDDTGPREAIAAARALLACPCDEHRQTASAAAADARHASDYAYDCAADDARDRTEDRAARMENAYYDAVWAAGAAEHAAEHAADPTAAGPIFLPEPSFDGPSFWDFEPEWHRDRLPTYNEPEWQRLRLAAYLLGEVDLDEPAI
jgi:hypothetical protein